MGAPTSDQLTEIGEIVCMEAETIFTDCGAADDFCIQDIGIGSVVFGGINRIIWRPKSGFFPDRSYCTDRFLKCWDNLNKK